MKTEEKSQTTTENETNQTAIITATHTKQTSQQTGKLSHSRRKKRSSESLKLWAGKVETFTMLADL